MGAGGGPPACPAEVPLPCLDSHCSLCKRLVIMPGTSNSCLFKPLLLNKLWSTRGSLRSNLTGWAWKGGRGCLPTGGPGGSGRGRGSGADTLISSPLSPHHPRWPWGGLLSSAGVVSSADKRGVSEPPRAPSEAPHPSMALTPSWLRPPCPAKTCAAARSPAPPPGPP